MLDKSTINEGWTQLNYKLAALFIVFYLVALFLIEFFVSKLQKYVHLLVSSFVFILLLLCIYLNLDELENYISFTQDELSFNMVSHMDSFNPDSTGGQSSSINPNNTSNAPNTGSNPNIPVNGDYLVHAGRGFCHFNKSGLVFKPTGDLRPYLDADITTPAARAYAGNIRNGLEYWAQFKQKSCTKMPPVDGIGQEFLVKYCGTTYPDRLPRNWLNSQTFRDDIDRFSRFV